MSDPFANWSPTAAGSAAAGGTSGAFEGWSPGAPATPATPAAALTPPAASHGGGGLLGFAGRALSGALHAVAGVPKGLEGLAADTGHALVSGSENIANDVAYGATLGHLGGINTRHLGGPSEVPNATPSDTSGRSLHLLASGTDRANELNQYPAFRGVVQGYKLAGNEVVHPTRLGRDFIQNPTGTVLNLAATAAPLLPVGEAASAGLEAAAPEGSLLARAAGAGAEGFGRAGSLANTVAEAPLRPFALLGRAALGTPAVSTALATVANTGIGRAAADRIAALGARRDLAPLEQEAQIPLADVRGRLNQEERVVSRLVPDPVEQGAATLNAQGMFDAPGAAERMSNVLADPDQRAVLSRTLEAQNRGNPAGLTLTVPMIETAVRDRLGLSDAATASRLATAENFLRGASAAREPLARTQGVGDESFAGPVPKESVVSEATGNQRFAAQEAAMRLRGAQADAGVLPGAAIPEGALPADRANLPKLTLANDLMSRASSAGNPNESLSQLAGEHGLQHAEQIPAYLSAVKQALGQADEQSPRLAAAVSADQTARAQLARASQAAEDSLKAAPAPYRPALTRFRDFAKAFEQEAAKQSTEGNAELAATMTGVASDLERLGHLSNYAEEGVRQPAHLIGADKQAFQREAEGLNAPTGKGPARSTKAGALRERKGNLTPLTVAGQAQGEIARYAQYARTTFANLIDRTYGVAPADVLGEGAADMNGKEIAAAMRDQGMTPWRPTTGTIRSDLDVTADTRFVPDAIAKAADRTSGFEMPKTGVLGHSFDALTRVLYRTPLQMSPFYMAHRIGSDVATMATHDMSLGDIVHYGREAARLVAQGDAPASLGGNVLDTGSGTLTANEPGFLGRARGAGQRATAAATAVPRVIDQLTSVAMYLKNLDEGADHVTAVRMANEALGRLNQLGPYEQALVRRVFPVYPWLKQVAATVRTIAADHPAVALFALNAGQQAAARTENGVPAWMQGFDPLRIFTIPPGSLVNPLVRAGAGIATGYNLSAGRSISTAPTAANPKGEAGPLTSSRRLSLPGALYFAGHQLPVPHIIEDTRVPGTNRTLLGQTPGLARYDTGALRLSKGRTEPALSKPYLGQFLFGNGGLEPKTPADQAKSAKSKLAATKAQNKRAGQLSRLSAKGVR